MNHGETGRVDSRGRRFGNMRTTGGDLIGRGVPTVDIKEGLNPQCEFRRSSKESTGGCTGD